MNDRANDGADRRTLQGRAVLVRRTRFSAAVVLLSGMLLATGAVAQSAAGAAAQPAAGADAAVTQSPEYKRGRLLFIQCRACHDLQPNPVEKVGPHLGGIVGRPAAAVTGFNYSPALRAAKMSWDKAALDRWIEKPSAVIPGNIMAFAGVANPADRAALLRYIEIESAPR